MNNYEIHVCYKHYESYDLETDTLEDAIKDVLENEGGFGDMHICSVYNKTTEKYISDSRINKIVDKWWKSETAN